MDFLNRYFVQIKELFAGMTPGGRVTTALLLIVTVVSLGYLFTTGSAPATTSTCSTTGCFPATS